MKLIVNFLTQISSKLGYGGDFMRKLLLIFAMLAVFSVALGVVSLKTGQ